MATFGAITLKENGIEYLYAWLNKHPDICLVAGKVGSVASEAAPAISLALPMTSFPLSLTMLLAYYKISEWQKGTELNMTFSPLAYLNATVVTLITFRSLVFDNTYT
jgi:hypothetical protein